MPSRKYPYDRLPCLRPPPRKARRNRRQPWTSSGTSAVQAVPAVCQFIPGACQVVPDLSMSCGQQWGKGPCHVPAATQKPETRNEDVGLAAGWSCAAARMQHGTDIQDTGASPSARQRTRKQLHVQTCTYLTPLVRGGCARTPDWIVMAQHPSASGKLAAAPTRRGHVFAGTSCRTGHFSEELGSAESSCHSRQSLREAMCGRGRSVQRCQP